MPDMSKIKAELGKALEECNQIKQLLRSYVLEKGCLPPAAELEKIAAHMRKCYFCREAMYEIFEQWESMIVKTLCSNLPSGDLLAAAIETISCWNHWFNPESQEAKKMFVPVVEIVNKAADLLAVVKALSEIDATDFFPPWIGPPAVYLDHWRNCLACQTKFLRDRKSGFPAPTIQKKILNIFRPPNEANS